MTDDRSGVDPVPEQRGVTPPPEPDEVTESRPVDDDEVAADDFTSGEGMVALGGAVILAGWFLFAVIIADYFTAFVLLLLSALAVLLPRTGRGLVERFAPLSAVMKALGYLIALVAVFSLVEDVRFASSALDEFVEILGALALYGGAGVALLGARSID